MGRRMSRWNGEASFAQACVPAVWQPALDDASRRWQAEARRLALGAFAERAAEIDREQRFPVENVADLRAAGITTMFLPREYGGAGASMTALAAVLEEIASHCASTSGIIATLQLGAHPLLLGGTDAQRREHLVPLVAREAFISFALSEPGAGSDPAAMSTMASSEGGGWRIRGSKCWIGNGGIAAKYMVFAQTRQGSGRAGIAAFMVTADAAGVRIHPKEDKMGMRGTTTTRIDFDVHVGDDAVIARPGAALRLALETLNVGRIAVAAQSVGIGLGAYREATAFSASRETFGQPILAHQGIGFPLADIAVRLSAARMMVYEAARQFDAGQDIATLGAMAKLFATEVAHDAVDLGVQVFGGRGYVRPTPVERFYRDQRATEIYEGTSEIQRMVLMRAIHAAAKGAAS